MSIIHVTPELLREGGRKLCNFAMEILEAADRANSIIIGMEADWEGPGYHDWASYMFEQVRVLRGLAAQGDDLGMRLIREANQWDEVDYCGQQSFAQVSAAAHTTLLQVAAPTALSSLSFSALSNSIVRDYQASYSNWRHQPNNPNYEGEVGMCLAYVQEFRGRHTFPKLVGSAYRLIYDPDFGAMRYTLDPGISDLTASGLELGHLVVWDQGQMGADPLNGHVAIITEIGPDYVIIKESNWYGAVNEARRVPIAELLQLHLIGYPPNMIA